MQLQEWLHKCNRLHRDIFDCVDWDANDDAFSNAPTLFSLWATKHISSICGVGKMMKIWKYWDDSACLSCDESVETTHHVMLCPCVEHMLAWDEAIAGLEAWMVEVNMDPKILHCICWTLQSRDPSHLFVACTENGTWAVVKEQDKIGWMNFLEGRISRKWQEWQEEYYLLHQSRWMVRTWVEGLVSNLLAIVHKMWITWNVVVHQCNDQGLKVKEGEELNDAIAEQFNLGPLGLPLRD